MVRQQIKDFLFALNALAVLPYQRIIAPIRYRKPPAGGLAVHLGCGATYIPGMINCDANALRKIDLWLDLRRRLPFPDASCSIVYCSHTLEHLFPDDALRLLAEIRRVLRPDGVARIAVPSLEHALVIARGGAEMRFPRDFPSPLAQAINYLFCDGQHKFGYCFEVMDAFARQAGFGSVENVSATDGVAPRRYGAFTLGNEYEGSLVVELRP